MSGQNLFAAPTRLRRLQIEITTGCNLRCAGCQRTLGLEDGTWRNTQMPLARFARILTNAPPADAIILQGIGEPTLHTELPEMIAMAAQARKFGTISFNTNALLRDIPYYAALRELGLRHVSISVDSLDPVTAEALRAGTDVARLRQITHDLIRLFDGSVTLSIVLSRRNLPELSGLLGELHGLGARLVEVQPLVSYAARIDPMALDEAGRAAAIAVIQEVRTRLADLTVLAAPALTPNGTRCRRPFHAAYVTVTGDLTPCCLTDDASLFGHTDLVRSPFEHAWQADGVRRFLSDFFDRDPALCHGCAFNPLGDPVAQTVAQADAMLRGGQVGQAAERFDRILADGQAVAALQGLGLARLQAGDAAAAVPLLRAAHSLNPSARGGHNLAMALVRDGDRAAAIALERQVIAEHPEYRPAYHGLSSMLEAGGETEQAAGVELALIERTLPSGQDDIVLSAVGRVVALAPRHPATVRVANLLRISGRREAAIALLDAHLAAEPSDLGAALARTMACLPVIYRDASEVTATRTEYATRLDALASRVAGADPDALRHGGEQVGSAKPFYLSYQGYDDRLYQRQYGSVAAAMLAADDDPAAGSTHRQAERSGPVRVGFATAYFHLHSISKLFGGWIRHLDRSRFTIIGYNLAEAEDAMAVELAGHCAAFHRSPKSEAEWIAQIRADRLDVLIYPEIGMHPTALRLACRRLAPVQCAAWGHPVTTGLPTMDYFLSSELMEPADGNRHYTETLIRLPGLSIAYDRQPNDTGSVTRRSVGLGDDAVVYVCCQSLFKYHPADDAVLPAIARGVPAARFLFIGDPVRDPNAAALRARLGAVFTREGLAPAGHLHFVPPVSAAAFPALLRCGDVYLDSMRWSGGNTTLEAIACGLPVVTLPGTLMRGRHSAAILRCAGAEGWIARDVAHYVALAVGLADPAERARARRALRDGEGALFGDLAPVRALEQFLASVVPAAGDARPPNLVQKLSVRPGSGHSMTPRQPVSDSVM